MRSSASSVKLEKVMAALAREQAEHGANRSVPHRHMLNPLLLAPLLWSKAASIRGLGSSLTPRS